MIRFITIILLLCMQTSAFAAEMSTEKKLRLALVTRRHREWNKSTISKPLFRDIVQHLPERGAKLLEIGSGQTTRIFTYFAEVWSIEDQERFLGLSPSHYIYAPIIDEWYDTDVLRSELPEEYHVLLVDGPSSETGNRLKLIQHFNLFKKDVPIFVDDVNRPEEMHLLKEISKIVGKPYRVVHSNKLEESSYGVIE